MVTIIHSHRQRLKLQPIAGPADAPMVMQTLSRMGIDLVYGDIFSQPLPLKTLLSSRHFTLS